MKSDDLALLLTAGLVIYLLNEKKKDSNKIYSLQTQNFHLRNIVINQNDKLNQLNSDLKKTIDSKRDLPIEIKKALNKLITDFDKLDKDISSELISVSSLIEINEKPKALFSLAKIIENILIKLLNKNISFYQLIEEAKNNNIVTKEEYYFLQGIRELRNKEGHKINVKVDKYLTASSFLFGIEIISKLKLLPTTHIPNGE